jgi:hypothetical protein
LSTWLDGTDIAVDRLHVRVTYVTPTYVSALEFIFTEQQKGSYDV